MAAALTTGPAQAASAEENVALMSYCNTWIDGEWGKASCYNSTAIDREAWIKVTCGDFWDPDVEESEWVQSKSTVTLTGHCWGGAVTKVQAGWK
ncbi:hypothetical protein ACWFMI_27410 [Nocardiopsis terrae]